MSGNYLVKLLTDDDGEPCDPVWHLVDPAHNAGDVALCTFEYFGEGESVATWVTKRTARGGITCEKCKDVLRKYKAVRL